MPGPSRAEQEEQLTNPATKGGIEWAKIPDCNFGQISIRPSGPGGGMDGWMDG